MKELSLNVLDIAQNSLTAGAENISIEIDETDENKFVLVITDDGCGMSEKMVKGVIDPFCTSRKTRKVGLGIPLLKMAAEQTGGNIDIISRTEKEFPDCHGTSVTASFFSDSIDFTPLGDIISTIIVLIQGHPDVDFLYVHKKCDKEIRLSTREMREVLGWDISLSDFEVLEWIRNYLEEAYAEF